MKFAPALLQIALKLLPAERQLGRLLVHFAYSAIQVAFLCYNVLMVLCTFLKESRFLRAVRNCAVAKFIVDAFDERPVKL